MRKVDVAIIGAGSAGLSARREVIKKTDNYIVVDDGILGTTCARVGCMPSKVLIQVAADFHRKEKFEEEGIFGGQGLSVDHKKVMGHVRKLRDRFVRAVMGGMDEWKDDKHFIPKRASFIDSHTLQIGDDKIQAQKIILAAGSSPNIPEILKDYKEYLIDTNSFFELEDLPESVAVIGLGVIGIEIGEALDRLGVNIFGIARRKNIAGVTDPVLNEYVTNKFLTKMNLSFDGIDSVEKVGNKLKISSGSKSEIVDKVLVTTGRSANLNSLNLKNTSLELNEKGIPIYSKDTFLAKGHDHIFIAGDITGDKQILHEASDEGKIAGYNSVNEVRAFQTRVPLGITFSDPNIAYAGQTYSELKKNKIEFEVGQVSFEGQGRSIVKLKEIGMLRVYGERKSGKLLGAELFAPDGEHLAHMLSWAMAMNLTVNEILALPFYHPVIQEGLRTALRDLRDKVQEQAPELEIYPKK